TRDRARCPSARRAPVPTAAPPTMVSKNAPPRLATNAGRFEDMVVRIVLAVALIAIACAVAFVLQRRRPAPPPRDVYPVPSHLDRSDFPRATAPWLAPLFSYTPSHSSNAPPP